jgi:exonuclease VII large subunit
MTPATQVSAPSEYETPNYEWTRRLDAIVERLTEASTTMAAHAQRLNNVDSIVETLKDETKANRETQQTNFLHLNDRIDDARRELSEKMEHQTKMVTDHFDKTVETLTASTNAVSSRVGLLETNRWLLKGGLTVVGVLATALIGRVFYVLISPDVIGHWFTKLF